jgi:hypothetical protein
VPHVSNVTIYNGIELDLQGSDQTAALSNAYGYAIFEGTDNGNNLGAFAGVDEVWKFTMPTGYSVGSCG